MTPLIPEECYSYCQAPHEHIESKIENYSVPFINSLFSIQCPKQQLVFNCIEDCLAAIDAGEGSSRFGYYWAIIPDLRIKYLLPSMTLVNIQECLSELEVNGIIGSGDLLNTGRRNFYTTVNSKLH